MVQSKQLSYFSKKFSLKTYYLLFTLALGLVACNKPPKACINTDATNVSVGTPVTFTSCSEKALSYTWFMNGPAGAPENDLGWSEEEFSRTFSVAGTYEVTLTAYEKFSWLGDADSTSTTIIVN